MGEVERRPWPRDSRYLVGDDGTIIGPGRWGRPGILATCSRPHDTRPTLALGRAHRNMYVCVVVCETFHGPRPPGMHAAHSNGDNTDNRATNLSWKTARENRADTYLHGTHIFGELSPVAKVTEQQVRAIRTAVAGGRTHRSVAAEFEVSEGNVDFIVHRKSWAHLEERPDEQMSSRGPVRRAKRARLNEDDVRQIRVLVEQGATHIETARQFGTTRANVSYIVKRETWAHVA